MAFDELRRDKVGRGKRRAHGADSMGHGAEGIGNGAVDRGQMTRLRSSSYAAARPSSLFGLRFQLRPSRSSYAAAGSGQCFDCRFWIGRAWGRGRGAERSRPSATLGVFGQKLDCGIRNRIGLINEKAYPECPSLFHNRHNWSFPENRII